MLSAGMRTIDLELLLLLLESFYPGFFSSFIFFPFFLFLTSCILPILSFHFNPFTDATNVCHS